MTRPKGKVLEMPVAPKSLTNDALRNIDVALAALRKSPLRPKMAFRVAHTINQLMPSFNALSDQESKIREKFLFVNPMSKQAERDEDGTIKIRDGFTRDQLDAELLELFEMESEVTLPKTRFKLKDFEDSGSMPVSPDTLLSLGELVVFEDEETLTPEKKK